MVAGAAWAVSWRIGRRQGWWVVRLLWAGAQGCVAVQGRAASWLGVVVRSWVATWGHPGVRGRATAPIYVAAQDRTAPWGGRAHTKPGSDTAPPGRAGPGGQADAAGASPGRRARGLRLECSAEAGAIRSRGWWAQATSPSRPGRDSIGRCSVRASPRTRGGKADGVMDAQPKTAPAHVHETGAGPRARTGSARIRKGRRTGSGAGPPSPSGSPHRPVSGFGPPPGAGSGFELGSAPGPASGFGSEPLAHRRSGWPHQPATSTAAASPSGPYRRTAAALRRYGRPAARLPRGSAGRTVRGGRPRRTRAARSPPPRPARRARRAGPARAGPRRPGAASPHEELTGRLLAWLQVSSRRGLS